MKTLKRTYTIKASPEEVFNAITNPFTIELWSGYPAKMQPEAETEFELWDGDIAGRNIEIIPGHKLVQEWYFGEQRETSFVTILLTAKGEHTRVELVHTNIPESEYDDFAKGWDEYYWGAVKHFFK